MIVVNINASLIGKNGDMWAGVEIDDAGHPVWFIAHNSRMQGRKGQYPVWVCDRLERTTREQAMAV